MNESELPVVLVAGRFVDEIAASEVAAALNAWFAWILGGSADVPPTAFEAFGVATSNYAWRLDEDVDWEMGPHARAVDAEVRIELETHETHLALAGLLRRLGARTTRIMRSE